MTTNALDFSHLRIGVIGDAMLDRYIHGRVERISPEAPVPVFIEEWREDRRGGAANVAANVEALGAAAILLSKPDIPLKTRFVVNGQPFGIRHDLEDCAPWLGFDLTVMRDFSPHLIIVSDYAKGTVTPNLMDAVRWLGMPFIVDPKAQDWSLYRGARLITPNEKEVLPFEGHDVLVTLGEHGMMLKEVGQADHHIPSVAREVFDVTGAGDTVIATIGCCLAAGFSLRKSAYIANVAAGIVVGKRGTAVCTKGELECESVWPTVSSISATTATAISSGNASSAVTA